MIVINKSNQSAIKNFIPSLKANMSQWQMISVKLPEQGKQTREAVLAQLLAVYKSKEGMIFTVSDYKIVMVLRMGFIKNYAVFKTEIESRMPKHDGRVMVRKMSLSALKQIQDDFVDKKDSDRKEFYELREKRKDNVILIAEDDAFVSQTLAKALKPYGQIEEVDDGVNVIEKYNACNPDIILLDIHMPNKSGLALVEEIMEIDPDAFIVIASADSVRDNVIEAISGGAVGFLAKPIVKEKIMEYLNQCITFRHSTG